MAKRKPKFIQEHPIKQRSDLDENGHEIPDSRSMEPALNLRREPTLAERIRSMVRSENLAREAAQAGHETFEEADDFDVGDDYDPESPYEEDFDPPPQVNPRPQAAPPKAEPPRKQAGEANPEPTLKAHQDGEA